MRRSSILRIVMLASIFFSSDIVMAQALQGKKIIFHVTSVKSESDPDICNESNAQCSAIRIRVEGYADVWQDHRVTQYTLTCSEIEAYNPSPHYTAICIHLHANEDYRAEFNGENLSFWGAGWNPENKPFHGLYGILSEKERKSEQ